MNNKNIISCNCATLTKRMDELVVRFKKMEDFIRLMNRAVGEKEIDKFIGYKFPIDTSDCHEPKMLNEQEAADLLQKSNYWLKRDRAGQRKVPFSKVGRFVLYSEEDILKYIEQNSIHK